MPWSGTSRDRLSCLPQRSWRCKPRPPSANRPHDRCHGRGFRCFPGVARPAHPKFRCSDDLVRPINHVRGNERARQTRGHVGAVGHAGFLWVEQPCMTPILPNPPRLRDVWRGKSAVGSCGRRGGRVGWGCFELGSGFAINRPDAWRLGVGSTGRGRITFSVQPLCRHGPIGGASPLSPGATSMKVLVKGGDEDGSALNLPRAAE